MNEWALLLCVGRWRGSHRAYDRALEARGAAGTRPGPAPLRARLPVSPCHRSPFLTAQHVAADAGSSRGCRRTLGHTTHDDENAAWPGLTWPCSHHRSWSRCSAPTSAATPPAWRAWHRRVDARLLPCVTPGKAVCTVWCVCARMEGRGSNVAGSSRGGGWCTRPQHTCSAV